MLRGPNSSIAGEPSSLPATCRRRAIVQVHVLGAARVLARRAARPRSRTAHPVHYDRDAADAIAELAAEGRWDPLPLDGELIRVDGNAAARPCDARSTALVPSAETPIAAVSRGLSLGHGRYAPR